MSNGPYPTSDAEIQPGHDVGAYELICEIRKTPTVLYGIFLEIVRQFYSNAGHMKASLADVVWSPSAEDSRIWIDTELKWEDEHPEFRPAIYVALSPITYTSLTGRADGFMASNIAEAETEFSRQGAGSVTFKHVGEKGSEACVLADNTFDYLDAYAQVIRDDFCFTTLNVAERVPLTPRTREADVRLGSDVTMAFTFQECWTLKLESQRLKKFTMRARQGALNSIIMR